MKHIAVLGSTGSIGRSTLEVIAAHPDRLRLVGIAAHSRVEVVREQIARYTPSIVAMVDEASAVRLRSEGHQGRAECRTREASGRHQPAVEGLAGVDGLTQLATDPRVDLVVVGTAGREALLPLLRAIEAGKQIALASKELLVMAGELIMQAVREHHTSLVPVDSEHAGLFQTLHGVPRDQVERLIITGSGGPLWSKTAEQIERATREDVLRHPKWQMGPKITVDSATLMNKGLEVIEAHWLFEMPLEHIHVVIHPQAVVHALIELIDGTYLAQMGACDMRLPIQYALSFPERWPAPPMLPRLRLTELSGLEFCEPDRSRFPCLGLALEASRAGGSAPAVLSAANEVAVQAFLRSDLAFGEIASIIRETLAAHQSIVHPTLAQILDADAWARQRAQGVIDDFRLTHIDDHRQSKIDNQKLMVS